MTSATDFTRADQEPAGRVVRDGVSRRAMLKGGTALAVLAAAPAATHAATGLLQGAMGSNRRPWRRGEGNLGKYLCSQVHNEMAMRLDGIIADPAINGESTMLALMEARCPGCGERVHQATSSLSAVVPQWRKPA